MPTKESERAGEEGIVGREVNGEASVKELAGGDDAE